MKANLPVEVNREKYKANHKSDIFKTKLMPWTSANTHLKVAIRVSVINQFKNY